MNSRCSHSIGLRLSRKLALVTMVVLALLFTGALLSVKMLIKEKNREEAQFRSEVIAQILALELKNGGEQACLARVRAGQRLELSAKEFQLLTLLMRRKGEVLSRTEIAEQVWDVNFDHGTNVIDVAIRRLRGKLDLPFEHPLLHTVRGMGYVLEDRTP